ncbi:hypothetical protein VP01_2656g1 [Puccinia sorghi]|uniref:Uncharacterized protein n=1 Tax=Puccinia sorghi TaxID=27349 RepID=A0A0L6V439_9BASI|nr:hypothetical protein VP01_2656g1 [Puccinia sorghi]
MYSPVCPIGAPLRNCARDRNPPRNLSAPRPRALTSTRTARPQGEDELSPIIYFHLPTDRNAPKKPSSTSHRALTSTGSARPQGMLFSEDELPEIIKNLQAAGQDSAPRSLRPQSGDRRGMVFDVENLPQELRSLQGHAPSGNSTTPA